MKKIIALVLVALMCMSFMTACGSTSNGTTNNGGSASNGGSTNSNSGSASTGSSDGADTIKIALITNTTGDYAMYGVPVHNAAKIYFDEVNAAGGINGKQLEVLEYDDKADGVESVNAFNLAMSKGVTAVLGSVLTGATIALSDATYEKGVPQVTASATAAGVTMIDPDDPDSEIRTNVFRSCFIDPFQGVKMADYAVDEYSAKNVAIFYQTGSDYSEGLLAAFEEEAAVKGLNIIKKEAFAEGDKDFKAQMTNIASANPDAVYMPIYYSEAGLAITALRAAGCDAVVLGGDGFGSVVDYASAEDLEGTVYCSGYAPGTADVADFEAKYQEVYGEPVPNMFAPLAYDAAMILCYGLKAAEEQGLTAGTEEYMAAVCDAIVSMDNVKGITGTYSFDKYNNPIKSAAIIECTNGAETFKEMY